MLKCWLSFVAQLALHFGSTQSFSVDDELLALRRGLSTYATMHGMRLDIITVVTADGWKLEVHRVRNMKIFNSTLSTPTYLSHGYGCSSFDYMANPRNESLAFILADRGYDVWAVNYRGNKFSNRKVVNGRDVKPKPRDYYKATWQYMAEYDVPAFLDKIIEVTGQEKIHLIGQSMGTTILFAFLSENHTYDDKLTTFIAIAPVLKFGNDTSCVIRSLLQLVNTLARVTVWPFYEPLFGARLLTARSDGVNVVAELLQSSLCRFASNACALVTNVFFQTRNLDRLRQNPHIRPARMALYFSKYPAGVTIMNSYLFARQFRRDPWTKMDYDDARRTGLTNMREYNQTKPPAYDFTKVKVPIVMYYTRNDIFTGVETAKQVIAQFKLNVSDYEIIDGLRMSHHDTLWGWDARCWIYDSLLARLDSIEEGRGNLKIHYFQTIVPNYVSQLQLEDGCRRN